MSGRAVCGMVLIMFSVGLFIGAFYIQPVKASGTIYIRADGSVDPATAPISSMSNVVYTFTNDVYGPVVVERSNIIVDGANFRLQGAGAGVGFTLNANNVTIRDTVITGFDVAGSGFAAAIYSFSTANNIIMNNTITGNKWGVDLEWVSGYVIGSNSIMSQGEAGIYMKNSQNNAVYGNDISGNKNGFTLDSSNNNRFYHNNFLNNAAPGFAVGSDSNVWDDGYPSGGNYWSDYTGIDANHDGIGDTAYVIDANNVDHYPLMSQYLIPEFPSLLILTIFMTTTLFVIIVYRRKHLAYKNRLGLA